MSTSNKGGVYLPPHKVRQLQQQQEQAAAAVDSASASEQVDDATQRLSWESLKKSITGLVNRLSPSNLIPTVTDLLALNIIRGRGLLLQALIKAQRKSIELNQSHLKSTDFTPVYAAALAIINTKFPEIGELCLHRIVILFRQAYQRNQKDSQQKQTKEDKTLTAVAAAAADDSDITATDNSVVADPQRNKVTCLALLRFIAHLFNQRIVNELLILQLCTLFLENFSNDSLDLCIELLCQCGQLLSTVSSLGITGVFERLREIYSDPQLSSQLHERVLQKTQQLFSIRTKKFIDFPTLQPELDVVEQADQITHEVSLDEQYDDKKSENIYHYDPLYTQHEREYAEIREELLGGGEDEQQEPEEKQQEGKETQQEQETEEEEKQAPSEIPATSTNEPYQLTDMTESDLINLRRTIYLIIMSSLSPAETAHKLLKMLSQQASSPVYFQHQSEVISMIIECCSMEKTYLTFYGELAALFCAQPIPKGSSTNMPSYTELLEECFIKHYAMIHRFETNRIRNLAKFFAQLLVTQALPWHVFSYMKLTEEDTTSAGRIFIKVLFTDMAHNVGILTLSEKLHAFFISERQEEREIVAGIMPIDSAKHIRFSINFFTSIGLGALTEDLRNVLKQQQQKIQEQQQAAQIIEQVSSESESSASSESSTSGSSDSESESSRESDDSSSSESSSSDSTSGSGRSDRGRGSSSRKRKRSRSPRAKRESAPRKRSTAIVKKEEEAPATAAPPVAAAVSTIPSHPQIHPDRLALVTRPPLQESADRQSNGTTHLRSTITAAGVGSQSNSQSGRQQHTDQSRRDDDKERDEQRRQRRRRRYDSETDSGSDSDNGSSESDGRRSRRNRPRSGDNNARKQRRSHSSSQDKDRDNGRDRERHRERDGEGHKSKEVTDNSRAPPRDLDSDRERDSHRRTASRESSSWNRRSDRRSGSRSRSSSRESGRTTSRKNVYERDRDYKRTRR